MAGPSAPSSHRLTRPSDGPPSESQPYLIATPTDPTMAQVGRVIATPASTGATSQSDATAPDSLPLLAPPTSAQSHGRLRFPPMPGYDLLGELGRGGMGVVYRAKQTRLNRLVALKMLLHSDLADPADVVRFRSEAEAVAAVKHPNVVQVYEFGHVDGRPYFAMEFLAGGSLHARLKASAPFAPEEAAVLVGKLARAVQAAHAQGIVHRDIKPGNVLFDTAGEPRVTDFGLAKRLASDLTQTQAVMGTPAYMAPEQASGRAKYAGPPADIYALGVILYECLTGATPFRDEDSIRLISKVIQDAPPSIRSRMPSVPRDLELICLKCLEKDPPDRYPTAAALADDLARYVAGEPVSVRPPGLVEQVVKWARRRPTAALAYGLGLLALILLLFGGAVMALWFQADAARVTADGHFRDAEAAREALAGQNALVEAANRRLEATNTALRQADQMLQEQVRKEQEANAELGRQKEDLEKVRDELKVKKEQVEAALSGEKTALEKEKAARAQADQARANLERLSYFRNVGFAHKELTDGNYLRAIQLLDDCSPAARKWEWWHVYRAAHTEYGSGTTAEQHGIPYEAAFSNGTNNVVTGHPSSAATVRFDFNAGRGQVVKFHPDPWVSALRLSDDGNRILTVRSWDKERADGVEVWDHAAGVRLAAWKTPHAACRLEMLSGDGRVVVVGYEGHPVRAYDVETGQPLGTLDGIALKKFTSGRMSRDGAVAAVIDGKRVVVWQVATGKPIRMLDVGDAEPTYVAVSPDGNLVAVGDATGGVRLNDLARRKVQVAAVEHGGPVRAIAFSGDGVNLATAGEDGVVRMWHAATLKSFNVCAGHTRAIHGLRFSADGAYVVSTDALGGFRVWDVNGYYGPRNEAAVPDRTGPPYHLSGDLTRLLAASDEKSGELWHYPTGRAIPFDPLPPGGLTAVGYQPGGKQMVLGGEKGDLFAFEGVVGEGQRFATLPARIEALSYTPDGRFLLATAGEQTTLYDTATLKPVFEAKGLATGPGPAAVSPDGKWVAVVQDLYVTLWDVPAKKATVLSRGRGLSAVGFTPDSGRLVVGTREWTLELWEKSPDQQGRPRATAFYVGHTAPVHGFAFSPDGTRLATGAADGTVKVWDVASRQEALSLFTGHKRPVSRVWWGPNDVLAAIPDGRKPVLFNGQPKPLTIRPGQPLGK